MINNLHSLLSGKWYIEPSAINGMLPMLQTILAGGNFTVSEKFKPAIITENGNVIVASLDRWGEIILPKANEPFVLVYPIKTTIFKYNQVCGPNGTKDHQKVIQEYFEDSMCIGAVLDVDSGGGQVSGTAEFYDFLKTVNKPIHTYTDGYLCSAAYYIASGTDSITANKRSDMIGSIGTMISFVDLTGYYEKQGAKVITEYATKSTAKNKSYRDLLAGNPKTYIQNELDPVTEDFINNVKASRPNINESVFDGSTYDAEKALEMRLIDNIGQLKDVVQSIFVSTKSKKSNNSKSNMKMSNHTKVMAVLGLATLAITEEKGSYFNEEQLQSMENALTNNENENEALQASVQAVEAAKEIAENEKINMEKAYKASMENISGMLGIPITNSVSDMETAINERLAIISKDKATGHTQPIGTKSTAKNSFIDAEADHNKLASEIHNQ